jgi:peroxiredoxin
MTAHGPGESGAPTNAKRWRARRQGWVFLTAVSLLSIASAGEAEDAFRSLSLIRPGTLKPAPDFTVPGLSPTPVRLADFKGRVVFLNFWATWCLPCKEEMPSMERLYRRHKARGFGIVALSIDTAPAATVAAFVKELGLTFTIGLDPKMEVAERFRVLGLPASFLIDREGRTVAVAVGPRDWDGAAAHAVVETLLASRPQAEGKGLDRSRAPLVGSTTRDSSGRPVR